MIDVLFILQCAYYTNGRAPTLDVWERRLLTSSHTGRRLREYIPPDVSYRVINSTLETGTTPDACFPPDAAYIRNKVDELKPKIVVACGKIAQQALDNIPHIPAPHPAWRQLSKQHSSEIRNKITAALEDYHERQL